jgi:hypothetical protein
MASPFESARLNLQLFELRRESVLREARAWFMREFNPESFEEMLTLMRGERNASFRMVLGYWDMAASLVTTGAIDAGAFCAAHSEIFCHVQQDLSVSVGVARSERRTGVMQASGVGDSVDAGCGGSDGPAARAAEGRG